MVLEEDCDGATSMQTSGTSEQEVEELFKVGVPQNLPTITQIKQVIPARCFNPKVSTSMYYVVRDVISMTVLYVISEWAMNNLPVSAGIVHIPLYWFLQGTMFTAIFVLGHDCGHGSFSHHPLLNDTMGTLLHSFLLCPYYTWKLSHKNHHKNTGNIDKDEVYYPIRKKFRKTSTQLLPGFGLGLGWFGYLVRGYKPRQVNHFNLFHFLFQNHILGCTLSFIGDFIMAYILYMFYHQKGFLMLVHHYIIPLFVFSTYMVVFTFLHHHDVNIPWYSDDQWNYVSGQLSSIDRDYGWVHGLTHDIGTHQIHHLFSIVPHYHLPEATSHFRKAFPHLVHYYTDPILPTFWSMFKKYAAQSLISDSTQIHVYK
ncbi:delta(12) fatty acid desaturase DES8.11 [Octopus sinensis]|uniref:Delta(12) fatty acid desaturase DES8.11 n=1 Tax=Octopus sinensis TaxID=2607531 RepID=A0A6P7SS31_9MOLL|nr:delta(12) fatty acid desaturase DES8.11 [Octopus sinensis]